MRWVVAIVVCATAAAAPAEPKAGATQRADHIAGLLDAIRTSDPGTLLETSKYIRAVERNNCQAAEQSLRVGCLLEAASLNCKQLQGQAQERCRRISDVIMTNLLSEEFFIPKQARLQIMNKHQDARAALARELDRRYAMLVTEFAMSDHFPGSTASSAAVATGLDRFCRETADRERVSWQYCVAAVIWVIGTDHKTAKGAPR
jgi:hypothetical protein